MYIQYLKLHIYKNKRVIKGDSENFTYTIFGVRTRLNWFSIWSTQAGARGAYISQRGS